MINLIPTAPHLFFSKNDPSDPRLGELFQAVDITSESFTSNSFAIMGYPDDEGIKLNGGRPGASDAPRLIRQFLYKMTPHTLLNQKNIFFDLGDLEPTKTLADRHQQAKINSELIFQKNAKLLSFGGGHDYGYSDTAGFITHYATRSGAVEKPIVLNFDAHLDVRPTTNGFNSGTPFYRLLTDYPHQFRFAEIGIQPQCNSAHHREWACNQGAQIFDLSAIHSNKIMNLFNEPFFKSFTKNTPVFISFDIDCLASSEGGGCSQSWSTGLKTQECLDFLSQLYQIADVRGLGIYEVSPALDHDFKTSKTAALLSYHFLYQDSLMVGR